MPLLGSRSFVFFTSSKVESELMGFVKRGYLIQKVLRADESFIVPRVYNELLEVSGPAIYSLLRQCLLGSSLLGVVWPLTSDFSLRHTAAVIRCKEKSNAFTPKINLLKAIAPCRPSFLCPVPKFQAMHINNKNLSRNAPFSVHSQSSFQLWDQHCKVTVSLNV